MNKKIFLLASTSFLLLAPVAQSHIFADVANTSEGNVMDSTVKVRSDADLKKAVTDAIAADKELGKFVGGFFAAVSVKADQGNVTLSGTVDNDSQRDAIETIAKGVAGNHVVNNITVKTK